MGACGSASRPIVDDKGAAEGDIVLTEGSLSVPVDFELASAAAASDSSRCQEYEPNHTPSTLLRIVHINDCYELANFANLKTLIDTERKSCRNLAGDWA